MAHIRTIAAALHQDGAPLVRMLAQRAAWSGAEATLARTARALLLDQRHRTVQSDAQDVIAGREIGVGLAVLDIRAEAADSGNDRLTVIGVPAHLARKRKQRKPVLEIDVVEGGTFRQAGALGLFALAPFAQLQIGSEAA